MKLGAIPSSLLIGLMMIVTAILVYFFPILTIIYFFVPISIMLLGRRHKIVYTISGTLFAAIILAVLFPITDMVFFCVYGVLIGCGLTLLYQRKDKGYERLTVLYLGILVCFAVLIIVFQVTKGQSFIDYLVYEFDRTSSAFMEIYKTSGAFTDEQITVLSELLEQGFTAIKMLVPTVFITTPFFMAWAIMVIAESFLKKSVLTLKRLAPLSYWQVPKSLKNVMAIILVIVLIIDMGGIEAFPAIYVSTLTSIIYLVFYLMGLAFVFWFIRLKKQQEPMWAKVLIVLLTMTLSLISYLVIFIGITDIYFGLRERLDKTGSAQS